MQMQMQFKIETEAQSQQVQEALFAAGYKWAAGQTTYQNYGSGIHILTGIDKKMTYGWIGISDEALYVLKDGNFYKEGEEPAPPKFKAGDKVICTRSSIFGTVLEGETYTVKAFYPKKGGKDEVVLMTMPEFWYADRFEIAPPEPEKEDVIVVDELVIDELFHDPRPPLGLRPRSIADLDALALDQNRLVEILEAMLRYAKAHKAIPDAWDDEYDEVRENLNAYYEPEEPFII
jgi:hypothetical protein